MAARHAASAIFLDQAAELPIPLKAPSLLRDPFGERSRPPQLRACLLGGRFEFETEHPELRRLVEWAYAGLPPHRSGPRAPRFRIKLRLDASRAARRKGVAPPIDFLSGSGLLAGVARGSAFAIVAPDCRSAIVNVSRKDLRFPHEIRYELIEFAVFTLAARALGLVPLHAGCVGAAGRGLLLIGDSGTGKSTLTLQCGLAGLDILSEDSVLVSPGTLRATGIPNFAHLCRDGLQFLPPAVASLIRSSPRIRRRSGVIKFQIDLRHSPFPRAEPPLQLQAAVFLSMRPAPDRTLLVPLSRREAASRLRATQGYGAGQPGWRAFSRLMTARPAFELLRTAHPAKGALALRELLSGPGAGGS